MCLQELRRTGTDNTAPVKLMDFPVLKGPLVPMRGFNKVRWPPGRLMHLFPRMDGLRDVLALLGAGCGLTSSCPACRA